MPSLSPRRFVALNMASHLQDFDTKTTAVLISYNKKRVGVPRDALLRLSRVGARILEGSDLSEELPMDNEFCSPQALQLLSLWLSHYAEPNSTPPVLPSPLPRNTPLQSIIPKWEFEFLIKHVVPGGEMQNSALLVALMNVANFLDIKPLLDLCCAFLSWHLVQVAEASALQLDGPSVTERVRGWFRKPRDYTQQEWSDVLSKFEWFGDITSEMLLHKSDEVSSAMGAQGADITALSASAEEVR